MMCALVANSEEKQRWLRSAGLLQVGFRGCPKFFCTVSALLFVTASPATQGNATDLILSCPRTL